jgi:hypothetical protein
VHFFFVVSILADLPLWSTHIFTRFTAGEQAHFGNIHQVAYGIPVLAFHVGKYDIWGGKHEETGNADH